jgi:hypothetical protein
MIDERDNTNEQMKEIRVSRSFLKFVGAIDGWEGV